MKKLMMAAAIVCAAAFAQAATVNWTVTSVTDKAGEEPGTWAVQAFYTAVGTGSDAIVAAINAGTASSLAFESTTIEPFFGSGSVEAHDVSVSAITDTANKDFYFVVYNNANVADATEYAMVSALDQAYSGMASKYTAGGDFTGASWTAIVVPEPTSGLLLLLGMAGLALRRKQK